MYYNTIIINLKFKGNHIAQRNPIERLSQLLKGWDLNSRKDQGRPGMINTPRNVRKSNVGKEECFNKRTLLVNSSRNTKP